MLFLDSMGWLCSALRGKERITAVSISLQALLHHVCMHLNSTCLSMCVVGFFYQAGVLVWLCELNSSSVCCGTCMQLAGTFIVSFKSGVGEWPLEYRRKSIKV